MSHMIIGRDREKQRLEKTLTSKEAEFIAVYGRRRVGKTYLIRGFFSERQKDCHFFNVTGILKASMKKQLREFMKELHNVFKPFKSAKFAEPKNWMDAFEHLTFTLDMMAGKAQKSQEENKKIVLFFDEFPWMATKKSQLLEALDYYWNRFWVDNPNVILIICGSAASWITKNILNNKGGLHNRVTMRLPIAPFTLTETQKFLKYHGVQYEPRQILQLYMCIGGIPYYLKLVEKGLSAMQNVNRMCFQKEGTLFDEFDNLFSSLFKHSDMHEAIIKLIASKREGMATNELRKKLQYVGGRLTVRLKELEDAGFIIKLTSDGKAYGQYYKVIDEYTLFYLYWINKDSASALNREIDSTYWEEISNSPAWNAWAGYAFEALCFKHLPLIKKTLKIPASARAMPWRHQIKKGEEGQGAQIDMLFDRLDDVVTICEIKYTDKPFVITKEYAAALENKLRVYKASTGTQKQLFLAMITASGIKNNFYVEELVTGVVILEDFFE